MADVVEQILNGMMGEGWEGIENISDALAKANREQAVADDLERRRQARIVEDVLRTPAGERFMLWLAMKTVMRPPAAAEVGATSPADYALAAKRREGQNSIFFLLVEMLDFAAGVKEKGTEQ